jgi:hypothetical protein
MEQIHGGRCPAGQCWSPAAVEALARASPSAWRPWGANLAITGLDRGRPEDAARGHPAADGAAHNR